MLNHYIGYSGSANLSYDIGIMFFGENDYEQAIRCFVNAIKPYLSNNIKSVTKEEFQIIKKTILDSLQHIGIIYENNTKDKFNLVKAAGIYQYCSRFAIEHELNDYDYFLERVYHIEEKLINNFRIKYQPKLTRLNRSLELESKLASLQGSTSFQHNNLGNKPQCTIDLMYEINEKLVSTLNQFIKNHNRNLAEVIEIPWDDLHKKLENIQNLSQQCNNFYIKINNKNKQTGDDLNHQAKKRKKPSQETYQTGFLQGLMHDAFSELYLHNIKDEFCLVLLGSFAKATATPFSDLEYMVLIKPSTPEREAEIKNFFDYFEQLFHIKIIKLDYSLLRNLGVKEFNNFATANNRDDWFRGKFDSRGIALDTLHGNGCKTISGQKGYFRPTKYDPNKLEPKTDYELLNTPKNMARLQLKDLDSALKQALKTGKPVMGVIDLFKDYQQELLNIHSCDLKKKQADIILLFKEDLDKFMIKFDISNHGKILNVKTEVYRIIERFIDTLINYHCMNLIYIEHDIWQMLNKLEANKILSATGATNLRIALAIAIELRENVYCHYNSQIHEFTTHSIYMDHLNSFVSEQYLPKQGLFYLKDTSQLHYFYHVAMSIQQTFNEFCNNYNLDNNIKLDVAKNDLLINDSNYIKGLLHARFLEYDKSISSFKQALADESTDPTMNTKILNYLYHIYAVTNNDEDMLNISLHKLSIHEIEYQQNPIFAKFKIIADDYSDLGQACFKNGFYDLSCNFYEQALDIYNYINFQEAIQLSLNKAFIAIGFCCIKLNLFDKAIRCFNSLLQPLSINYSHEEAYELKLNDANSLLGKGILCAKFSNFSDDTIGYKTTLNFFFKALEIKSLLFKNNPNHQELINIYRWIADIYYLQHDYENALKAITVVIKSLVANTYLDNIFLFNSLKKLYDIFEAKKDIFSNFHFFKIILINKYLDSTSAFAHQEDISSINCSSFNKNMSNYIHDCALIKNDVTYQKFFECSYEINVDDLLGSILQIM